MLLDENLLQASVWNKASFITIGYFGFFAVTVLSFKVLSIDSTVTRSVHDSHTVLLADFVHSLPQHILPHLHPPHSVHVGCHPRQLLLPVQRGTVFSEYGIDWLCFLAKTNVHFITAV